MCRGGIDLIRRTLIAGKSSTEFGNYLLPFSNFSTNVHNMSVKHGPTSPRIDSRDELRDAMRTFREMMRMEPGPSVVDFTKLISSVVKMKHYSDALYMFDEMRLRGAPVNEYTMTIAINCYCLLKRVDFGFGVMGIIFKSGFNPNAATFTTLIRGLFLDDMVDDAVNEAEKVLEIMLQQKICPNIVNYGALIDGYCLRGELKKAKQIFDSMVSWGLKPDIIIYNSLIDGYCKKGRVDEALLLFLEIPSKGLEHDIYTYSIMIHGMFTKGRFDDGWKLFEDMEARGVCPNIVTYNALIYGLCKNGELEAARDLFYKLPSKGLQPNVIIYTTIIGSVCQEGSMEEAKCLLKEMENCGYAPDSVTYNVIVRNLLKRNEFDMAIPFLEEMPLRGFSAEATTFALLINQLQGQRIGDFLLKLMKNVLPKEVESGSIWSSTYTRTFSHTNEG